MKDVNPSKQLSNPLVITRQNLVAISELRLKVSQLPSVSGRYDPTGRSASPKPKVDQENQRPFNPEDSYQNQKQIIRARKFNMLKELIDIRTQVLDIRSSKGVPSNNLVLSKIFKFLNDHYSQLFGFRDIIEALISFVYVSESGSLKLGNLQNERATSIGSLNRINVGDFTKVEDLLHNRNSQTQNIRSSAALNQHLKGSSVNKLPISSSMKQLENITSKVDLCEKGTLNSAAVLKSPTFKEPMTVRNVSYSNLSVNHKDSSKIGLRYMISPSYGKKITQNDLVNFSDMGPQDTNNINTFSKQTLSKLPLIEPPQNIKLNSTVGERFGDQSPEKADAADLDNLGKGPKSKEQKLLEKIIENLGDCNFYFPTYKESYEALSIDYENLKQKYSKLLTEYSKLEALFNMNKEIVPGRMVIPTDNAQDLYLLKLRREKFEILQIALEKTFEVRKFKAQLKDLNRRHNTMFEQVEATAAEVFKYRQYVKMAKEEIKKVKNENDLIKLQIKQWVKKHEVMETVLESTMELFRNDVTSVMAKIVTPNTSRSMSFSFEGDMSPARSPAINRPSNPNANLFVEQLTVNKMTAKGNNKDTSRVSSRGELQCPKPILKKRLKVNNNPSNNLAVSPKIKISDVEANLKMPKKESKPVHQAPAQLEKNHRFDVTISPTETNEANRLNNNSKQIYKELQDLLNRIPGIKSEWEKALIKIDTQRQL